MNSDVKNLLINEADNRNSADELSYERPDPLIIAKKYKDEYISLVCALFAYGNAKLIVKFLDSLDFTLLDNSKTILEKSYYRFQSKKDVVEFFKTIRILKKTVSIEDIFYDGYKIKQDVMDGLKEVISCIYDINPYRSRGYEFLIGKIPASKSKSPYKRWHMYLRWMVRYDNLDMGLWSKIDKKDLLVPLDTHTFKVGQKLGLISRKSYDFQAVIELTNAFKCIDKNDPIRFDFALYRIGQEKKL